MIALIDPVLGEFCTSQIAAELQQSGMRYLKLLPVAPTAKPTMTKRDVWKARPCVLEYRAFCDAIREEWPSAKSELPQRYVAVFIVPFPKSYSARKRNELWMTPCQSRPDTDNYLKAFNDAIFSKQNHFEENISADDSHLWDMRGIKLWGNTGGIHVFGYPDAKSA